MFIKTSILILIFFFILKETNDTNTKSINEILSSAPPDCIEETTNITEVNEIVAPSAPLTNMNVTQNHIQQTALTPKLQYPDLKEIQHELLNVKPNNVERIKIKPFTMMQLKELYANPEVQLAQQFETEFINIELNANHKSHILYELLIKYSRCRHNLKTNELDLQGQQNALLKDSTNIWERSTKTLKYQATCGDAVIVSATETYEYISAKFKTHIFILIVFFLQLCKHK